MDRKALSREYKDTPRPMGVYRVRNTANGKSLVGASTDLPARLNRHRAQLTLGAHPNHVLQTDWNTLGPDVFEFEVIDTLKPSDQAGYDPSDDLQLLEQMWLEKLSPFDERGYNTKLKRRA